MSGNALTSYLAIRKLEIEKIRSLLKKGYKPRWHSPNNWFYLGKYVFNGYTREMVEKLMNECVGENN